MVTPFIVVIFTLIFTGVCYFVAKRKNLSVPFWIAMGALFGPFAIPFVFLAKSKSPTDVH